MSAQALRQVAVIGAGGVTPESEAAGLAKEVGRLLAEAGVTIVCGGGQGVMAAAASGAAEVGGEVIGVVPGSSLTEANEHCTHIVCAGIGHGRNLAVVGSGAVVIAVGGEWGTLSEIGLARTIGRTVIALHSWHLEGHDRMRDAPGVIAVDTPEQAVERALAELP